MRKWVPIEGPQQVEIPKAKVPNAEKGDDAPDCEGTLYVL
jgi:hypothetical protein